MLALAPVRARGYASESGELAMRLLKTAPGAVLDVAFSSDCRAIAAAVEGAGVFLWNLDSPTIAPVRLEVEGDYRTGGLTFSADGRQLAWRTADGVRSYCRDGRSTSVEALAILERTTGWVLTTNGSLLISTHGIPDHAMAGWQFKSGEWVRQWKLSTRELSVQMPTLAPAGDRFAIFTRVTGDGRWWEEQPMRLEVRDAATSAELAAGTYPYSYAGKLVFHPCGEQIAGINDMTLLAWTLPTGGAPRLARNDSRKHFTALAYHPDGRSLFVTSNDKTVHVFDTRTLDRTNRYTWQLDELSAVAVAPDGMLAAAGSANGDVVVWDLE
jgi:WD40 repeat protein